MTVFVTIFLKKVRKCKQKELKLQQKLEQLPMEIFVLQPLCRTAVVQELRQKQFE